MAILGIIPLFFVYNYFSQLAAKHDRSKVGFGMIGIFAYLGLQMLLLILLGILLMFVSINACAIVLGLLAVGLVYILLKKSWEKKERRSNSELLDN
jgi:predicted tellurium resistance membrane protein TerC